MARMRTLKPTFFQNERLADLQPLCRLLFQGLWCLADREGRLEDRPRRIKAEVLPYDDCDVEQFLNDLVEAGFIVRYSTGNTRAIQVLKFRKHQTPHIKEAASTLPAPVIHGAATVPAQGENHASTPSSGEWVVGSGVLEVGTGGAGGLAAVESSPSAPPAAALPGRVKPAPKPIPRRDRFAETLDAIKALDPELVIGGNRDRNAKAVNESMAEPGLLAAAYVALMRGEWQDSLVAKQGSLHAVVDNIGGYVNAKRRPAPTRSNGYQATAPPSADALERERLGQLILAKTAKQYGLIGAGEDSGNAAD